MLKKISIKIEPYLYMLPAIILIGVIVIYPTLSSFRYALYDWSGLGAMKFVGFDNLYKIFSGYDKQFWNSIKLTFIWVALSTVILSITSLMLAFIVEFGARNKIYLFREAFVNNNYGYGCAISVVLFLIAAIFSIVFMWITSRVETYY